jgi:hypothetical protein
MPRKPRLPRIPGKPTIQTKPEQSPVVSSHRPDLRPEQIDFWGLFCASMEGDQAAEPRPKRPRKPGQGRGSRAS